MNRKWFTADTHFNHEKILEITGRKFGSVDEHDEALIENINRCVQPTDLLYIVGDFCWHGGEQILKRIRCQNKYLILGNHDRAKDAKQFKAVEDTLVVKACNYDIFLSHYPHAYWPSSHRGGLHVYGHVHSEREETLDTVFPGRRSMDVGIDNAFLLLGEYRPFMDQEIVDRLIARPGHDPVEWYEHRRGVINGKLTQEKRPGKETA